MVCAAFFFFLLMLADLGPVLPVRVRSEGEGELLTKRTVGLCNESTPPTRPTPAAAALLGRFVRSRSGFRLILVRCSRGDGMGL